MAPNPADGDERLDTLPLSDAPEASRRASCHSNWPGLGLVLLAGAFGSLLCSPLYAGWMYWMHPVFKLFAPIGYGATVGYLIGYGARVGRMHNHALIGPFALLGGLGAWYGATLVWLALFNDFAYIPHASEMPWYEKLAEAAERGVGSTAKQRFQGTTLWVFWALELLTILAYARYAALKTASGKSTANPATD